MFDVPGELRWSSWRETVYTEMLLHHSTSESFMSSVDQQCRICVALWRDFTKEGMRLPQKAPSSPSSPFSRYIFANDGVLVWVKVGKTYALAKAHLIATPEICSGSTQDLLSAQGLKNATLTSADDVIGLARHWMQNCLHRHKTCTNTVDTPWYPRRLLYVSGGLVKLQDTRLQQPHEPYVTLSHCWGGTNTSGFATLTRSNMEKYLDAIGLDSLPKTFTDAINITTRLGFNYLWIDSLCILQSGPGSKQDWLDHTTEMRHVYTNCALNISADAAQSPVDGCYSAGIWHGGYQSRTSTVGNRPDQKVATGHRHGVGRASTVQPYSPKPPDTSSWPQSKASRPSP